MLIPSTVPTHNHRLPLNNRARHNREDSPLISTLRCSRIPVASQRAGPQISAWAKPQATLLVSLAPYARCRKSSASRSGSILHIGEFVVSLIEVCRVHVNVPAACTVHRLRCPCTFSKFILAPARRARWPRRPPCSLTYSTHSSSSKPSLQLCFPQFLRLEI